MFVTFRGGTLVAEASLCLRVLSCPVVLMAEDKAWLMVMHLTRDTCV